MKNFPHQFNDLDRLTQALAICEQVLEQGAELSDSKFGQALAQGGVYTFRDKSLTVEEALVLEAEKPRASRGTEAAARDTRRFLLLLGFIAADPDQPDQFVLTDAGRAILDVQTDNSQLVGRWRTAMLVLGLADANENISHPYPILLRLVADNPGIENSKLMLALEAQNDSEEEYARIQALAERDYDEIVANLELTQAGARNAVKILPAIARQIGDIVSENNRSYPINGADLTEDGEGADEQTLVTVSTPKPAVPRSVKVDEIAATPNFRAIGQITADLTAAVEIRTKRIQEHQQAVREIAAVLDAQGFVLSEYPYDCLGWHETKGRVLVEVKTLDGSPADEKRQSQKALGQLKSYEFFDIEEKYVHDNSVLIAAFTRRPSDQTIEFLKSNEIRTIWQNENNWLTLGEDSGAIDFNPDSILG